MRGYCVRVCLCLLCLFGTGKNGADIAYGHGYEYRCEYGVSTEYDAGDKQADMSTEYGTEGKQQDISEDYDIDYNAAYADIYDMLEIDSIELALQRNGFGGEGGTSLDFSDIIQALGQGDTQTVFVLIGNIVKKGLLEELLENRTLMVQLIAIALLGSIFINISGSFGNGFIGENGFYVTYLIMTSLMLASFSVALEMVSASIERVLILIRIIVPAYALAMNYVGHSAASVGMYEVILVAVWLVQVVILKFVIPMIKFYVIVSLVNNLNKEDSFSKLCQLIRNLVKWMLKTVVVFIAGLNIIKSLIEPQIDAIGRNTVNKVISAIPGGGMMSVLTGTFLGAGLIIKNCIGIAGILFIGLISLIPIIKTFLIMFTIRLTGAMIQPIGEKRYVSGVEALSGGMGLLLQTIGSSVVLFMLTIAIMAYASN